MLLKNVLTNRTGIFHAWIAAGSCVYVIVEDVELHRIKVWMASDCFVIQPEKPAPTKPSSGGQSIP